MTEELSKRITDLEQEVHDLRREVEVLKQSHAGKVPKQILTRPSIATTEIQAEKHTPPSLLHGEKDMIKANQSKKPTKSLEERIMWALPKMFMLILVLGVLWGLKLISDYGYLSNGVKLVLTYVLSIGLVSVAFLMEKKQSGSPAITVSLYGGAFIIGILATAAGAIIYEVLPLYTALFITLLYITYGIIISYFKKNEVLTNFVAFTSLLLPYLLDYMEFNEVIILAFIVVLFSLLQVVILKHAQRIALYVSYFFSILASLIVWAVGENSDLLFTLGTMALLGLFIFSWWRLYVTAEKFKSLQEGLLFSLSSLSLVFMNFTTDALVYQSLLIIIVALFFTAIAMLAYKRTLPRIVDVLGTLALLAFLNVAIVLHVSQDVENVLVPLSSFIGMMVALRLRAAFMKVTYTIVLSVTTMVALSYEVVPFWHVGHLILFMQFVYIVSVYVYAKRPKASLDLFEQWMKKLYVLDIVPVAISIYFFAYMYKLDMAYITKIEDIPYFVVQLVAIVFVGSLLIHERYIGRFLPVTLSVACLLFVCILLPTQYDLQHITLNSMTRVLYIGILVALMADMYMEGMIYKKWARYMERLRDRVISVGVVLTMLSCTAMFTQLAASDIVDWRLAIAGKTVVLFVTAGMALWLSTIRHLRVLRLTGFGVLFVAIIKLIFFDLSSLDLFVRAILFITVGGLGLVLSNRLLKHK